MGGELLASERLEARPVLTDFLGKTVGKKNKKHKIFQPRQENIQVQMLLNSVQTLHLIGKQWCVHVRVTT